MQTQCAGSDGIFQRSETITVKIETISLSFPRKIKYFYKKILQVSLLKSISR